MIKVLAFVSTANRAAPVSGQQCFECGEDNVQCRDRRACYILSDCLSEICNGEQFGTMQQVLKYVHEYADAQGLIIEPNEEAARDSDSTLSANCDDLLRRAFHREYIQLTSRDLFPLLTTHLTKLPFSF